MGFLKADVNLKLLFLILIIVVVFVSSNVYYQNKIRMLEKEYNDKLGNLKAIEEKLLLKEEKLNEISELKNAIKKDKEMLEIGYLNLQSENQNLKKSLVEDSKPFGKLICKATGNVQCLN